MKRIRSRITYANVMSTLAVFLVVGGGTAFAATQLPSKSVGSKQLKGNAVTKNKIKKNAVTGAKVRNGTLTAADFKAGQLPSGPQGATGPQGEKGPAGEKGAQGEPGIATIVTRVADLELKAGETGLPVAKCLPGEIATGGGVGSNNPFADFTVMLSEPIEEDSSLPEEGDTATAWAGKIRNDTGEAATVRAFVLCATP